MGKIIRFLFCLGAVAISLFTLNLILFFHAGPHRGSLVNLIPLLNYPPWLLLAAGGVSTIGLYGLWETLIKRRRQAGEETARKKQERLRSVLREESPEHENDR